MSELHYVASISTKVKLQALSTSQRPAFHSRRNKAQMEPEIPE